MRFQGLGPGAAWALAAAAAAAALRLSASFNDLWLDEVWTLDIARSLGSPLEVFTSVRHANNHHLNTLLVWILGDGLPDWAYRLPAAAFGTGSVLLAGRIAGREGRLEGALAAGLAAGSYLLVHYSSEARGYAALVFFALLAFHALRRFDADPRRGSAALFWLASALGWLSHLQFLHVSAAAAVWSLWRLRGSAADWLRLHAVPALLAGLLWAVDVRHMSLGAGPSYDLAEVLVATASVSVGGPLDGAGAGAAALLALGLLAASLERLRRKGDDLWLFYLAAIVVSPALALASLRPEALFPRYFLVGAALFLLAAAPLLADLLRAGPPWRAGASLLLAGFAAGNAAHLGVLLRDGRGRYREALSFIAARGPGTPVAVGSDHDFRNGSLVRHHGARAGAPVAYVPARDAPSDGVPWLIRHRIGLLGAPEPVVFDARDNRYALERAFPSAPLSGFHWLVYRKQVK